MFNEFILSINTWVNYSVQNVLIIIGIILLISLETFFIVNIKEQRKKNPKEDFPFIEKVSNESDLRFVIKCKFLYLSLSIFLSIFIFLMLYGIGALIYIIPNGVWLVIPILFILINYLVYKIFKQ